MDYKDILQVAKEELTALNRHLIDVVEIKRPPTLGYAKNLAKIISKLSPMLGNMIEFSTVDMLNRHEWAGSGYWIRQDPEFPDALFRSNEIIPNPGIEIKAWFPLATEITARFKDSVTIFKDDNIDMALIAWLPEHVIWGKPQIIDVLVVSGKSVAVARDNHYHKPPDYIVFEPEDTSARTANLQQTNTNGYKLQQDKCTLEQLSSIHQIVNDWGDEGKIYSPSYEYQRKLRELQGAAVYRLDTNYAKIDRIGHTEIEAFKNHVLMTSFHGKTIKQWSIILATSDDAKLEDALRTLL